MQDSGEITRPVDKAKQSATAVPFEGLGSHAEDSLAQSVMARPTLVILCHPDLRRIGERAVLADLEAGPPSELSRTTPLFCAQTPREALGLLDSHISRKPLILRSDGAGGVVLDAEHPALTYSLNGHAATGQSTVAAAQLQRGAVIGLGGRVLLLLGRFAPIMPEGPDHGMIGASAAIERTRREISQFAGLNVPILIRGETGSGKERVARAMHAASDRSSKPFVAVNMAAIAPSAAASELFGHKRGAFTDAVATHTGYFGAADGGTLFLDEIGETPPSVQTLLLRALDEGQIQPVGGQTRTVNVRLICATDADLEAAVREGRFRDALLHRIAACSIDVPPLRRRREEIAVLLLHFLREQLAQLQARDRLAPPAPGRRPWLPPAVMLELMAFDWPGNVRQLRNVATEMAVRGAHAEQASVPMSMQRARTARRRPPSGPYWPEIAAEGEQIGAPAVAVQAPTSLEASGDLLVTPARRTDLSDEVIAATLAAHQWNFTAAARALGIAKNTLVARTRKIEAIRRSVDLDDASIVVALAAAGNDVGRAAASLGISTHALAVRLARGRRGED